MFKKIFGSLFDSNEKQIKQLWPLVQEVNKFFEDFDKLSDLKLVAKTEEFKNRIQTGESLADLLPEAFAVVKQACRRLIGHKWEAGDNNYTWDMVPFDVQILGGIVLHQGKIAEMKTGEGKTLVATMPMYLNALSGKGTHLITVNDYLARRDSEWMGEVYRFLGMSVGCIQHGMDNAERKQAYAADITYGTNNEFGFDYLRDNMVPALDNCVQRDLNYAIVDEVDSILIDEARTPLIISGQAEDSVKWYEDFARLIPRLHESDYEVDEKTHSASLKEEGIAKIEKWLGVDNLYEENMALAHYLDSSLQAYTLYKKDKDYVVKEGEVIIVDSFTGRLMPGRRYSEGLHQAIEAKERVSVKKSSQTLATITFQNYFRMYNKLSGMTGTAATEAEEFDKIYKLEVLTIPTNQPVIRKDQQDYIYKNKQAKFKAIVQDVKSRSQAGQPVLVGTVAVESSEELSNLFTRSGIKHSVLNAKFHEKESNIIADAGKRGAVTIATNMAGRGTDIKLGGSAATPEQKQEIIDLGGLAVIGSERHESRRIDNQLRGRSGRQGEPGESRFYVALDDDLMRIFGGERVAGLMERLGVEEDVPLEHGLVSKSIESAQKKVEGHNFDIRKHLVEYDDVMNKQRELVYKLRRLILQIADSPQTDEQKQADSSLDLKADDLIAKLQDQLQDGKFSEYLKALVDQPSLVLVILLMIWQEIESLCRSYLPFEDLKEVDYDPLLREFKAIIPYNDASLDAIKRDLESKKSRLEIRDFIFEIALKAYQIRETDLGHEIMRQAERVVLLRTIDKLWMSHLDVMADLREGIGLRGYGQRDPLVEYKQEGFRLFQGLIASMQSNIVKTIYRIGVRIQGEAERQSAAFRNIKEQGARLQSSFAEARQASSGKQQANQPVRVKQKVGRNDPCPCGSGKKYKKCCGANT